MTAQPFRKNRDVVPRWRPVARVLASGELSMPNKPAKAPDFGIPNELKERLEAWRRNNDVISAAELVETAIVEGMESEAERAARTLTAEDSTATPLVQKQASMLLGRLGVQPPEVRQGVCIGDLRQHIYRFPDDAFSWADLALGFGTIGKKDSAKRAMAVALQLAPFDRHILRSAARMYLHFGDKERAHDLLKNNAATKSDPWLVAGEIALSAAAGRKPSLMKVGTAILDSGHFQALHVSELASAIGTVHLRDGNRKARKLFGKSLLDPTGNSLAQAEWANPHLGGEIVSPRQIEHVRDSGEAGAFHAYWEGDFERMLTVCEHWMTEEPFSSQPYIAGSMAAITNDNMLLGMKFARNGLVVEPNSAALRNQLAYTLIANNEFTEAAQILRQTMSKHKNDSTIGFLLATTGMLALRQGDIETGISRYQSAMALFKRQGNQAFEASAAAFLAFEAARAGSEKSDAFVKQAEELTKNLRYAPEAKVFIERAKRWNAAVRHRQAMSDEMPVHWHETKGAGNGHGSG
jgi:tetratricopeptide (TPR) repeat protein